jgi:hypothetical protein
MSQNIGLRFTSFFDYKNGDIYYTGGMNMDNAIYKLNILSGEIIEINHKHYFSRAGSTSMSYEEKAIIFSGFTKNNNIPVCYSDYYIFSLRDNNTIIQRRCNEFVGRTFSKSILLKKYHKILFMLGTYNGMEQSRSIIYYDYAKDYFMDLGIQDIPLSIVEGIIFYIEKENKIYISGGVPGGKSMGTVYDNIWELDIGKIEI